MKSKELVPGAAPRREKRGSRMVEETPPFDWPDTPSKRPDVPFEVNKMRPPAKGAPPWTLI